jgi:urea-proton symporter
MLSGNLIAILSSALIHYVWSVWIDPQDYDFSELDTHISLVEQDMRGLSDAEKDPKMLDQNEQWIKVRGYILSIVLVILWPLLSVPAGVFSRAYFSFWVLLSVAWGFGAALTMFLLPLIESSDDILTALNGIYCSIVGKVANDNSNESSDDQSSSQQSQPLSSSRYQSPSTELSLPSLDSSSPMVRTKRRKKHSHNSTKETQT